MDSIITDGFQFAINSAQNQAIVHSAQSFQAVNLQGKLNGGVISSANRESSTKQKIPTIIITAHYDAMGLATVNYFFVHFINKYSILISKIEKCLSYGCDSTGSGVVALLEIARLFSSLYSNSKTIPPINLLFVLTAEGAFNYHGLKKWIEEQSEVNESKNI